MYLRQTVRAQTHGTRENLDTVITEVSETHRINASEGTAPIRADTFAKKVSTLF